MDYKQPFYVGDNPRFKYAKNGYLDALEPIDKGDFITETNEAIKGMAAIIRDHITDTNQHRFNGLADRVRRLEEELKGLSIYLKRKQGQSKKSSRHYKY